MPGGRWRIYRLVNSMNVLLIDPLDTADSGPLAGQRWDRIVGFGMGGVNSYERWTRQMHCPITTLDSFRDGFDTLLRVRDLLGLGSKPLVDEYGLEWWEIMSLLLHGELEALILLQRFVQTLASDDELYVSRPGLHASLLQCLLPARVRVFPLRRGARKESMAHYLRVYKRLSVQQMIDVFWDKYDSGYQFRGRLVQKRSPSRRPVVLLPTAYINVSRTGMAYANTFPDENFLLVTTRRSGWVEDPPRNVASAWLSSYAAVQDRSKQSEEIESRWLLMLKELRDVAEFANLNRLGYLYGFPQRRQHGLEVRDPRRNVLDTPPVHAVPCAHATTPYP